MNQWTAAEQVYLSFTISQSLLKLMSIESVMPSKPLALCHHLLLLPSIFPSIKVFSNESELHITWPKYWSFSISPSNEYSGLISLGLTGLISLQTTGLSTVFFQFKSKSSAYNSFASLVRFIPKYFIWCDFKRYSFYIPFLIFLCKCKEMQLISIC